jgi:hypothetical protein
LVLLAALVLARAAVAGGEDLWDRLGPARIGAAHAQIAESVAMQCTDAAPEKTCLVPAGRFGGVPVDRVEARFRDQRLERVVVRFGEPRYRAMLATLQARLGEAEDRSFRARAGMAGEFAAGVKLWELPAAAVVLEQFAGKIDRSTVSFGTIDAMQALLQQKRSYPPGSARDL